MYNALKSQKISNINDLITGKYIHAHIQPYMYAELLEIGSLVMPHIRNFKLTPENIFKIYIYLKGLI